MIRVAIVGTGHAARHHLAAVKTIDALDVVAVGGRDISHAESLVRECCPGAVAVISDEAVRLPEVDAVIIAVAPVAQAEPAIHAFRNGKHVLCEKPLAPTLGDARRIEAAWKAAGTVGMVNFCYRLIPELVEFRSRVDAGACGSLSLIRAEWVASSRLNPALSFNWKADVGLGGGVLQNLGSHMVDYLFHDKKEVSILGARQRTLFPSRPEMDGTLRAATGDEATTVLVEVPGACPVVLHLSLVTAPPTGHRVIAQGSLGTLEAATMWPEAPAGPYRLAFSSAQRRTAEIISVPPSDDGVALEGLPLLFRRVLVRFRDAIARGVAPLPDISAGVRAVVMTEAIQQASRPQPSAR